jgi:hypothetical protein
MRGVDGLESRVYRVGLVSAVVALAASCKGVDEDIPTYSAAGSPANPDGTAGQPSTGQAGNGPGGVAEGGAGATTVEGASIGEQCSGDPACRTGLVCEQGTCAPSGSVPSGGTCLVSAECDQGQCVAGTCQPAGEAKDGEACATDGDCAIGLRCELSGLRGTCQSEGNGDVGGECELAVDCLAGLVCVSGTCSAPSLGALSGAVGWSGVDCPAAEEGPVRAYFEVPGAEGADEGDFFRLPFPNDARRSAKGRLDLSGFPTPGVGVLGFDPVMRYVEAIEAADRGWGTYPTVIFRFSGVIDAESLKSDGKLSFVDISADEAQRQPSAGWEWQYTSGPNAYVCGSRLLVRRPAGAPLVPGHVYAVYFSTGVLDPDGEPVERSPNLAAVLGDDEPSDRKLGAVHQAYEPLRQYLAEQEIDPETLLNATVITVGNVRDTMRDLADEVASAPLPKASHWVRCAKGVESPCPERDAEQGRACGGTQEAYAEYQALVSLPIFQEGSAPYLESGGGIVLGEPQRTEQVCLSLTVPKGNMPGEGWPLVVFAHGTGGSFRSHVTSSVAGALSKAPLPGGDSIGLAVLGIDQVQHGTRRGKSDQDPEDLFFNFANPAAARGNPLQGAADQLALARFAAKLDVDVDSTTLRIDPAKIFFFGHSQGSTEGSLMLPFATDYRTSVLSGNGASIRESLVSKTSPVNIKSLLPLLLGDRELATDLGGYHPVLGLIQQWMDPADPLNFAAALAVSPVAEVGARNVFATYGLDDTYSPPATLQAFVLAGGFAWVDNSGFTPERFAGLKSVDPPLAGNLGTVTLGFRQYEAATGSDGHFVAFDVDQANEDMVRFLAMAANGDTPAIGE